MLGGASAEKKLVSQVGLSGILPLYTLSYKVRGEVVGDSSIPILKKYVFRTFVEQRRASCSLAARHTCHCKIYVRAQSTTSKIALLPRQTKTLYQRGDRAQPMKCFSAMITWA